jgi:hypothetical protein
MPVIPFDDTDAGREIRRPSVRIVRTATNGEKR